MIEKITGITKRIMFQNDEGFSIAGFRAIEPKIGDFTATGTFINLKEGDEVTLLGTWENHQKYGRQFKVTTVDNTLPMSRRGIISYLASDRFHGIGQVYAELIYDHFGADTLKILEKNPEKVKEVQGIGKEKANAIKTALASVAVERQALVFLLSLGITQNKAVVLYNEYGTGVIGVVKKNPYILIEKVKGFGFKQADDIATRLGFDFDDRNRIRAGIIHILTETLFQGHTARTLSEFLSMAQSTLGVPLQPIADELKLLIAENIVVRDTSCTPENPDLAEDSVFLAKPHANELTIAKEIVRLSSFGDTKPLRMKLAEKDLTQLSEKYAMLSEKQRNAVKDALRHPVSVICGGPGTGKSTLLHSLVQILEAERVSFSLCAPTGRASTRISEITGNGASTIHRLLGYNPETDSFNFDRYSKLNDDFYVMDEASMTDAYIFSSLLEAIPNKAHLLIIGDPDQLPSVGAGSVLNDIIASGNVHTTRLTEIFRQDEKSFIVLNAHRINNGETPIIINDREKNNDFFFFCEDDPYKITPLVKELVLTKIPENFGFDAKTEIQVLSPMYKGNAGVDEINLSQQESLNPPSPRKLEKKFGDRVFRVGDKVMQLANKTDMNISNGDIGYIVDIHPEDKVMDINFNGSIVIYPYDQLENLTLAYCATVHKSQGGEYPCVVMVMHHIQRSMLKRNLFYTGETRAKKLFILVGSKEAIVMAVKNNEISRRRTGLKPFLSREFENYEKNKDSIVFENGDSKSCKEIEVRSLSEMW